MTTTTTRKTLTTLGALAVAGLALTGCTAGADESESVDADGTYVFAPDGDDGLFTMTVAGKKLKVTHSTCAAGETEGGTGDRAADEDTDNDKDGPDIDPRETAFGELGDQKEDSANRKITWLQGGSFTEESSAQFAVLSGGQIISVGDRNFFNTDGSQGKALQKQFEDDCGAGDTQPPSDTGDTDDGDEDADNKGPVVDSIVAEEGDTYLRSNEAGGLLSPPSVVGPWLTAYYVDGDQFTYKEIICTGQAVTTATGTIEDDQIVWDDGADPWIGDADHEKTPIEVSDDEADVDTGGKASADVSSQQKDFVGQCEESGEDVADVFR